MVINKPYLLFLGDASDQLAAKTAEGVAYWRRSDCVGQLRLPGCNAALHLPDLAIAEASELGARTLLVGVANRGGLLSGHWLPYSRELPEYPLPGIEDCLAANEAAARLTNPNATSIGISLNKAALDEDEALKLLGETGARTGLPCVDAVRTGVARLVDCLPV